MKQTYFNLSILIFAFVFHLSAFAQQVRRPGNLNRDQRIEKQTDYIASTLMLDDETQLRFETVYTQYLKDLQRASFDRNRFDFCRKGKKTALTDEQAEQLIEKRFEKCREILDLREKYYKEFRTFLSSKQILKMYSEERNFGKQVREEIEKRAHRKKMAK